MVGTKHAFFGRGSDMRGCDLRGLDLASADISGCDMRGACLVRYCVCIVDAPAACHLLFSMIFV